MTNYVAKFRREKGEDYLRLYIFYGGIITVVAIVCRNSSLKSQYVGSFFHKNTFKIAIPMPIQRK